MDSQKFKKVKKLKINKKIGHQCIIQSHLTQKESWQSLKLKWEFIKQRYLFNYLSSEKVEIKGNQEKCYLRGSSL